MLLSDKAAGKVFRFRTDGRGLLAGGGWIPSVSFASDQTTLLACNMVLAMLLVLTLVKFVFASQVGL